MRRAHRSLLIIGPLGLGLLVSACSGGGNFGAADGQKTTNGKTEQTAASTKADREDEAADEPAQVAGAFLSCAFMDKQTDMIAKAQSHPEAEIDIGCGLINPTTKTAIDSRGLNYNWTVQTHDQTSKAIKSRDLPAGSDLRSVISVPVRDLAGNIVVSVADQQQRRGTRARSIPSITAFDANSGFKVSEDDGALGRSVAGIGTSSSNNSMGMPNQQAQDSNAWWIEMTQILAAKFGEQATQSSYYNDATNTGTASGYSGQSTSNSNIR